MLKKISKGRRKSARWNYVGIEKLLYCAQNIFIQEYTSHPFIDVYVTKLNKGDAFGFVVSKLSEKSDFHGKIMYLGDSENDNLPLERQIFQLE